MDTPIVDWYTRCQHCEHFMTMHLLDWTTEDGYDCVGFDCTCPGFEPAKENADG